MSGHEGYVDDPDFMRIVDLLHRGNDAELRELLAQRPELPHRVIHGYSKSRMLHLRGTAETTRILIEAGADLEAEDAFGCTPLLRAASEPSTGALAVLLESGADPLATDQFGSGAIGQSLSEAGHPMFRPEEAYKCVRMLIAAGFKPTHKDLAVAIRYGHADVTRLLLKHGADPYVAEEFELTAYQLAYDQPKIQELLRRLVPGIGPERRTPGQLRCLESHPSDDGGIALEFPNVLVAWSGAADPIVRARKVFDCQHVRGAVFHPSGEFVVLACNDIEVRRWPNLEWVRSFPVAHNVESLVCSPTSDTLAITGHETLLLCDLSDGSVLDQRELGEENFSMEFSADGAAIAVGAAIQGSVSIEVFQLASGGRSIMSHRQIDRYWALRPDDLNDVYGLRFSPRDSNLVVFFETDARWLRPAKPGWFGRLCAVDITSGIELWRLTIDQSVTGQTTVNKHGYRTKPAFSRDGSYVGIAVQDLFVQIDSSTGAIVAKSPLTGVANGVSAAADGGHWVIGLQHGITSLPIVRD